MKLFFLSASLIALSIFGDTSFAGSITTTFSGGNGLDGNMFDVTTFGSSLLVTELAINKSSTTSSTLEVYTKPGSYVGSQTSPGDWTLVSSTPLSGASGSGNTVDITDFTLPANSVTGIYITLADTSDTLNYTSGANTYSNADLKITTGVGKVYPFARTFSPRTWNGTIIYTANSETLENKKKQTWTAGVGEEKTFKFEVPENKTTDLLLKGCYSLEVETKKIGIHTSGSCDMYLKRGSPPTTSDFDMQIGGVRNFKKVQLDIDGVALRHGSGKKIVKGEFEGNVNTGLRSGTWYLMLKNSPNNTQGSPLETNYEVKVRMEEVKIFREGNKVIKDEPAWLLIHGKQGKRTRDAGVATFGTSAEALAGQEGSQALIVDWSGGASSGILDLSQGRYFVPLAKKIKTLLKLKGLRGSSRFSVLAHSWGTLVGHEFATLFNDEIDRFVALDPAKAATGGYADGKVDFRAVSDSSWSFVAVQGIFGSEPKAKTAEHAVAVHFAPYAELNPGSLTTPFPWTLYVDLANSVKLNLAVHGAVVHMFEEIIDQGYGPSSGQPDNISDLMLASLTGYDRPWRKNRVSRSGYYWPYLPGAERFEAFLRCDLDDVNGLYDKLRSVKFINRSGNKRFVKP